MTKKQMKYLLEVSKIIEAGLHHDSTRVAAYANQLLRLLKEDGDTKAAKRIGAALSANRGVQSLTAAYLAAGVDPVAMPADNESSLPLAEVELPSKPSHEVVLDDSVSEEIEQFISYVESGSKFKCEGLDFRASLLLFGPPGCGKTMVGRYIAHRLDLPLFIGRVDALISSYLGSTAKNIRALFDTVSSQPCVLFLDEVDSMAKLRDDQNELGELKRVVISLLQNIDLLHESTILLAATNHEHLLDPAIWRRFAFQVKLSNPDTKMRERLFEIFLQTSLTAKQKNAVLRLSEDLSPSDIEQLCLDARRTAIISGNKDVDWRDILFKVAKKQLGPDRYASLNERERIKYFHEIDPSSFSTRKLGKLFGRSHNTISKILKVPEV